MTVSRRGGCFWLALFLLLLIGLPVLAQAWPGRTLAMIDAYKTARIRFEIWRHSNQA